MLFLPDSTVCLFQLAPTNTYIIIYFVAFNTVPTNACVEN